MSLSLEIAIGSTDTTLIVNGTIVDVDGPGVLQIESEKIAYTDNSENQFYGLTRGYGGTTAAAHAKGKLVTLVGTITQPTTTPASYIQETYVDVHSHQSDAADLTISATAGSGDGSNPKYLAASMWNIFGDALTRVANYIGGVIGAYSVTGTKASTYPTGAVLAQITDGVTDADGAVVAYIDGDSRLTKANAAFKVMNNNSTTGSQFHWGLDMKSQHDGYNAVSFLDGEIRFSNGTKVTVAGDTIVFTNAAGNKSFTITMS